jgi:hypothetical protein
MKKIDLTILISTIIISSYLLLIMFIYIFEYCINELIIVEYQIIDRYSVIYKGIFKGKEYFKECILNNDLQKELILRDSDIVCPNDEYKMINYCHSYIFGSTFIITILGIALYELYIQIKNLIKIEIDTSSFNKKDKLYGHI